MLGSALWLALVSGIVEMYSPAPCLSANGMLADIRQAEEDSNALIRLGLLFSAYNIMMSRNTPRLQIEHMWSRPGPSSEEPTWISQASTDQ